MLRLPTLLHKTARLVRWGRVKGRHRVSHASAYVVGDTWYDPRSAEILRGTQASGGWRAWAGRVAARFSAVPPLEETRAITSVPWNVGSPLGYQQSDQDRALSLVPVYAAVRLLADTISTLPVKAYRKDGDGRIPMPALPQLFKQLDESGELTDWLHRCMTSLALRGNAYGLITSRDGMQFPTSVYWLNPSEVACDETNPMRPVWYWQGRHVPTEDLIHIPWFTVAGKVQGLSPIEAYAATVNVGLQAQRYSSDWFQAGGVPPGTFKNTQKTVGQTEAREIKSRLVAAIRSHEPIVYGSDWDYNPITIPPEQAQFIQTMKLTATQIAAIYGIPPEMIGGDTGGNLTYSSPEQNTTMLSALTFRPWIVKLERKFSAILPLRQYVKLNIDSIVRADMLARYQSYLIAHEIGLLSTDEIRALEERPPFKPGEAPVAATTGIGQTPGEAGRLRVTARPTAPPSANVDRPPPALNGHRTAGVRALLELRGRRFDPTELRKFNPAEPRGPHTGKWIDTTPSDGGNSLLKDVLKLAGTIDLDKDERLVGSDKVAGDRGTVRLALTERHGDRLLRIGLGDAVFGSRDDDAGPWRGGPDKTAATNAERKRLRDEMDAITAELDRLDADPRADPARKAALEKRYDELDNMDKADVYPSGHTARLDEAAADRLRSTLSTAVDAAAKQQASLSAHFDELDRLEAERDKLRGLDHVFTPEEDARWDRLTAELEALKANAPEPPNGKDYWTFADGTIPGDWADIHYEVYLDDVSIGPVVLLGAVPHGSGLDLHDLTGNEQAADLSVAETRKLLRLLARYAGIGNQRSRNGGRMAELRVAKSVQGAEGAARLKAYWLHGEGAAKWVGSPHPFTSLYRHLVKYMNPDEAKRTAAEWFHQRFGFWPGSDMNRVTHGHPPRGKLVGPG